VNRNKIVIKINVVSMGTERLCTLS